MKKFSFKYFLLLLTIIPTMLFFTACGGDPETKDSPPPAEPGVAVTYELSVDLLGTTLDLTPKSVEYNNILTAESFAVKLKGSDGSSVDVSYNPGDTNSGFNVTSTYNFGTFNELGEYEFSFNHKTYSKTVKANVVKAKIEPLTLETSEFVYNGEEVDITNYLSTYSIHTISLDTASSTYEATNASEYSFSYGLVDAEHYEWTDGTTASKTIAWEIVPRTIEAPNPTSLDLEYKDVLNGTKYEGVPQTLTFLNQEVLEYFEFDSNYDAITQTTIGTRTSRAKLKDNANYVILGTDADYVDINWKISPMIIPTPTLKYGALEYSHKWSGSKFLKQAQTNELVWESWVGTRGSYIQNESTLMASEVGTYTVKAVLGGSYRFSNGSRYEALSWEITKKGLDAPTITNPVLPYSYNTSKTAYSGVAQTFVVDYHGENYNTLFTQSGGSLTQTNVCDIDYVFTLVDDAYYYIKGTTETSVTANGKITPARILKPYILEENQRFEYSGSAIVPTVSNIDEIALTIFVPEAITPSATSYEVVVSIKDAYNHNFVWEDGSTENVILNFYIDRNEIVLPTTFNYMVGNLYMQVGLTEGYFIGNSLTMCQPMNLPQEFYDGVTGITLDLFIDGNPEKQGAKDLGTYTTTARFTFNGSLIKLTHNGEEVGELVNETQNIMVYDFPQTHTWELKKHPISLEHLVWDFGDLSYTGSSVSHPVLKGDIVSPMGAYFVNQITTGTPHIKFEKVYTTYKYNGETYEEFSGSIIEKGKYKVAVQLVLSARDSSAGEWETYNIVQDVEHFTISNIPTLEVEFEVGKECVDMINTKWGDTLFTYNNNPQAPVLLNLPEGVSATYTYKDCLGAEIAKPTAVGAYTVEVSLVYDTDNNQLVNNLVPKVIQFEIEKKFIDSIGIQLTQDLFTYDATTKTVAVDESTIPSGVVVVSIENNAKIVAGVYFAKLTLSVLDENTYTHAEIEIEWEIEKAPIDMALVCWNKNEFTYNGEHQAPSLQNLPSIVTLSEYSIEAVLSGGNQNVDNSIEVGGYIITANITFDSANYVLINNNLQPNSYVINQAVIDVSAVIWENASGLIYSSKEQNPTLSGLSSLISVTYTYYNLADEEVAPINAGSYYVVATISFDTKNYKLSAELELVKEFTIQKDAIDTSSLVWPMVGFYEWREEGYTFAFDETKTTGKLEIAYIHYTNEYGEASEAVEIPTAMGRYKVVATLNYDSVNYSLSTSVETEFIFEIVGRTIDTSSIEWVIPTEPLVYNRETQYLYVTGVPEGIETTYSGATEAGEHSFSVCLSGENYASTWLYKKYTIEKATIDTALISLKKTQYEYSRSQHYLSDWDGLVHPYGDDISITFITGHYATDVGKYTITAELEIEEEDNYNPISFYYFYLDWEIIPLTIVQQEVYWYGDPETSYSKSMVIPFIRNIDTYLNEIYTYYEYNDTTLEYEEVSKSAISRAGQYKVTVEYSATDLKNYNIIENDYPKYFEFKVVTSNYDFSNIMINPLTYRYSDGKYAIMELDPDLQFKNFDMYSYRGLMLAYENFAPNNYYPYGSYDAIMLSLDKTYLEIDGEMINCEISGDDPNGGEHGGEYTTIITLKLGEGYTENRYNKETKTYEISWVKLKGLEVERATIAGKEFNAKEFMRLKEVFVGDDYVNDNSYSYVAFVEFEYQSNEDTEFRLYSNNGETVGQTFLPANNSTHRYTSISLTLYAYHEKIEIKYDAGYTQVIDLVCVPKLAVNGTDIVIKGFPTNSVQVESTITDTITLTFDVGENKPFKSLDLTAGEIFSKFKIYWSDSRYYCNEENIITSENPTITIEENNIYLHIKTSDEESETSRKYVVNIIVVAPSASAGE